MAYDKHTWTCDEPITVERLNHIEDGIANAGGGDCGYECEETITLLTEESVTTTTQDELNRGVLSYSQLIDAEVVKVTFNGTEYECPRIAVSNNNGYGGVGQSGPDFSQYPFAILSGTTPFGSYETTFFTEIAGTYTVKIEAFEETITTTPCFAKARGYSCDEEMGVLTEESVTTEFNNDAAYGDLSYSQLINQDTITVTFNGTEYECEVVEDFGAYLYGALYDGNLDAWDWSEYPFQIYSFKNSSGLENTLATETAGTYSVKIEGMQEVVTTTSCFEKAVKSVAGDTVYANMTIAQDNDGCMVFTLDKTDLEVASIIAKGQQLVVVVPSSSGAGILYPTLVWASGASDPTPIVKASSVVGGTSAIVMITFKDQGDNERLVTLSASSGVAEPNYLTGRLCAEDEGYSCETTVLTEETLTAESV